ncbi:hypothetical protein F5X96DRAFT_669202 [Biscogniauxia mediterranea]|nr:hypothetical protein F5X96DRAFT_669202 [Biscogniauxia mediterranea]
MAAVTESSSPEVPPASSAPSSRPLTPIQEHEATDGAADEAVDDSSTSSETSQASSVTSVVNFHVDSDAVVLVKKGNSKTLYQISSCSIALASPVWCAMLYGQDSKERPAKGEWSITLEADPKALDTIFRIVHYQFNKVPTCPDLDELFEIACLISEYKCTYLTYPWADKWVACLADFPSLIEENSLYAQCHKVIWIAWVFGAVKLFEKMTNVLIATCSADADGRLTNTAGTLLSDMILPPGLLELTSEIRLTIITMMLEAVGYYIKHLSSGNQDSKLAYCKVGKDVRECEAMMLGSVIPKLVQARLYPVPKGSDVTLSILDLKTILDHIETIPYVGRDWMPHQSHEPCCFIVRDLVSACVENMPSPLKDDYLDHLTSQADISGIQCNSTYQVLRQEAIKDADIASSVSSQQGSVGSDASDDVVESEGSTTA